MSALVADDERASRQATGRAGLNVGRASHEMGFQLDATRNLLQLRVKEVSQ